MLFAALLLIVAVGVLSDGDVESAVREVATIKVDTNEATWCPAPVIGTKCPEASIFHYYKCCSSALNECCFNLQTWVIVVLAVVAVMMLASFVLSILRCLFCRR